MKSVVTVLFVLTLSANNVFGQSLPKKPSRSDIGSYNQANLLKIDIGASKNKVIDAMGGVQKIQTYVTTSFMTKKEGVIINNPVTREFKTDSSGSTVEILWYYTNVNKADGDVNKEQQTPIVLEKNAVVGIGWDFYEDYAKRKGINIESR